MKTRLQILLAMRAAERAYSLAYHRPQMARSRVVFFGLVAALLLLGVWLGYVLAGYEKLAPYKLLNIIGIVYGLLGIVVLAEFVTKSESIKAFMVNWVAGLLLWAHTIIPLGAIAGAGLGHSLPCVT